MAQLRETIYEKTTFVMIYFTGSGSVVLHYTCYLMTSHREKMSDFVT